MVRTCSITPDFQRQKPMRLFTEATLLKMETSCTRLRKEIEDTPTFWQTRKYPQVLLKTNQTCALQNYLWAVLLSTATLTLSVCIVLGIVIAVFAITWPQLWAVMHDPKNHALLIRALSHEGVYNLPLVPIAWLLFSLVLDWPRYYFWNRRAKRLQREGSTLVSIVAAAELPDDTTVWPPPPRS